ncbi:MAG: hypothetical protein J2P28_27090, partial [Actinobacteria bacterium]|nr:hypothetical protein [Actinomycetota bacterium]
TPCGTVTSGAPSPTLGVPIAMAYVRPAVVQAATKNLRAEDVLAADDARAVDDAYADDGALADDLAVDVRGRAEPATLVELPFYRRAEGTARRS